MNTFLKLSPWLMILVLTSVFLPTAGKTMTVQSNSSAMTVRILDAYYYDASGDGFEDDVNVVFSIDMNSKGRTNFKIYFTLTLPSGRQVTYGYAINTVLSHLDGSLIFHNDATEAGWYDITIQTVLLTGGATYAGMSHVFDPPGETSGGDPDGELRLF